MDRQQILDLYDWAPGTCFRHPDRGEVPTALVKVLRPRGDGRHEVRACEECVIAMEDARRETAARSGSEYRPGPLDRPEEQAVIAAGGPSERSAAGENLGSDIPWGVEGE